MNTEQEASDRLKRLLMLMGIEAVVTARDDGERVTLDVSGAETALVIGKKGQTLDALQYLVNRMVSQASGDESRPISVDAEGYRERRVETLTDLAHRLADKARKTGKPVAADPMSPADRRIIHVALADAVDLKTQSEGDGIFRHLVIIPISTGPSGSQE